MATRLGWRVGLLDADVHGPSLPTMMSLQGEPAVSPGTPCGRGSSSGSRLFTAAAPHDDDRRVTPRAPHTVQQAGWAGGGDKPLSALCYTNSHLL